MKKKQKGFSLLEIACILTIMGIIGLAAIPSIKNVKRQETNEFIRELGADLSKVSEGLKKNDTAEYELELTQGSSGKYIGYQIKDQHDVTDTVTRAGAKGFDITVSDEADNMISSAVVKKFTFKDGKIKSNAGTDYTVLKVKVDNDGIAHELTFYLDTGYYKID